MRKFEVLHVPYWGSDNPYQKQLGDALGKVGVEVRFCKTYKKFFGSFFSGDINPDLIHFHWLPKFKWSLSSVLKMVFFILRFYGVLLKRKKIVITAHNIVPHETEAYVLDRFFRRTIARHSSAIIAHGESVVAELRKTWSIPSAVRTAVVPHASYISSYVNIVSREEARERLNIATTKLVYLFLGSLRPYKGVVELVEAFKSESINEALLLVAGKPINEKIKNDIDVAAKGADVLTQFGFVDDDDIQIYMNAADVVVFPYRRVLTSGAVLLAQSFGKACLVPDVPSMRDILDVDGAFFFEQNDSASLKKALRSASDKHSDLMAMGRRNYERVFSWGWPEVASATRNVYEGVLNYSSRSS